MDPVVILGDAVDEFSAIVAGIAPDALFVGISVFGLLFGWGLVKRFVH